MNKPTLTIAIPAYNEEANIGSLLGELLNQSHETYALESIAVYSDGSTDNTNKIVEEYKNKGPVVLNSFSDKKGKIARENQIFNETNSDILIILDADIGIKDPTFIQKLIEPITADDSVNMVASDQEQLPPQSLSGFIIYSSFVLWDYVRLSVPGYDHVQNYYGPVTAFRKSFYKTLNIPPASLRVYLYLMAKKTNSFKFLPDLKVYYHGIESLKEYFLLSKRQFGKDSPILDEMFGIRTSEICIIDRKYVIKGILKCFRDKPILTITALLFTFLQRTYSLTKKKEINQPVWDTCQSTKKKVEL